MGDRVAVLRKGMLQQVAPPEELYRRPQNMFVGGFIGRLHDAALTGEDGRPRLRGKAELREALGAEVLMHFSVQARAAVTDEVRELAEDVGDDRVADQLGSLGRTILVGRFGPQTRIQEGDLIEVAIDEDALHFFDASTGGVIRGSAAVAAAI